MIYYNIFKKNSKYISNKFVMTSQYLLINSADRIAASESSSNFIIDLQKDYNRINSIELFNAVIPNAVYTVNDTNNKVYFRRSAVDYTATLGNGNYTANTLTTIVSNAMLLADVAGTYSCSFSSSVSKFSISNSAAFQLTFASNTTNSAASLLGFNAADSSSNTIQVGDNVPVLSTPFYFMIKFEDIDANNYDSNLTSYNFAIPAGANYGEIIRYDPPVKQCLEFATPINMRRFLRIRLIRTNTSNLAINGGNFAMQLKITQNQF